jgi:hypothetical protein
MTTQVENVLTSVLDKIPEPKASLEVMTTEVEECSMLTSDGLWREGRKRRGTSAPQPVYPSQLCSSRNLPAKKDQLVQFSAKIYEIIELENSQYNLGKRFNVRRRADFLGKNLKYLLTKMLKIL